MSILTTRPIDVERWLPSSWSLESRSPLFERLGVLDSRSGISIAKALSMVRTGSTTS